MEEDAVVQITANSKAIAFAFANLKESARRVRQAFVDLFNDETYKEILKRIAIEHYDIPESDIWRVILTPGQRPQVQLYNWRKIEIDVGRVT